MLPSEKMAERSAFVSCLRAIDNDIVRLAGEEPTNRVCHDMMRALEQRSDCADDMRKAGYEPWDFPLDVQIAEAV